MRPEHEELERLIQKISPTSELLRAWPLKGGVSAQMTAVETARPGEEAKKWIVRRYVDQVLESYPNAAIDEFKILQAVYATEIVTPKPYHLEPAGEIFSNPCLILEYIEGEPECAPSDVADFLSQLATKLAEIHRVEGSDPRLAALPGQAERLTGTFTKESAKRLDSIDIDIDIDTLSSEGLRETLALHWPLARLNKSVLLHGDFWPGNVLVKGGRIAAVIDWEDAELGDPLADLSVSRLDILWMFGIDAMNNFTRQYQAVMSIDFTNLPYWDLCAALPSASSLTKWAEGWAQSGRPDITEETMRSGQKWFVTQAFSRLPRGAQRGD